MQAVFQMSYLGLLSYFLGIKVIQDASGVTIVQSAQ